MTPAALGIRHVALFVADLAAAERFWVEVMGYTVEWRPDPDNVYLHGHHDNLALHRSNMGTLEGFPNPPATDSAGQSPASSTRSNMGTLEGFPNPPATDSAGQSPASSTRGASQPGAGRLDHIGIAVPAPGDVDAWAAHLTAHGVPLKTQPKTHRDGSRSIYFHGPEQLLIQIIHHAPLC